MLLMWRYGDVSPKPIYRIQFSHDLYQTLLFSAVSRPFPRFIRTQPSVGEWDDPASHRDPLVPPYSFFKRSLLRAIWGGRVECSVDYDFVNRRPIWACHQYDFGANTSETAYYVFVSVITQIELF